MNLRTKAISAEALLVFGLVFGLTTASFGGLDWQIRYNNGGAKNPGTGQILFSNPFELGLPNPDNGNLIEAVSELPMNEALGMGALIQIMWAGEDGLKAPARTFDLTWNPDGITGANGDDEVIAVWTLGVYGSDSFDGLSNFSFPLATDVGAKLEVGATQQIEVQGDVVTGLYTKAGPLEDGSKIFVRVWSEVPVGWDAGDPKLGHTPDINAAAPNWDSDNLRYLDSGLFTVTDRGTPPAATQLFTGDIFNGKTLVADQAIMIPEPSTWFLLLTGIAGMLLRRRRKQA
jgi:hypothetical protein